MKSKENNDTNELIYGTETDSNFKKNKTKQNKTMVTKGKMLGGGIN